MTTPIYGLPYQLISDAPNGATLGAGLADAVEDELARVDANHTTLANRVTVVESGPNVEGWAHFSVGETTSSIAFANLGAGSSVAFTKRSSSTRLKVEMHAQFVSSATGRGVEFGVNIGGFDYLVAPYHQALPAASARLMASGTIFIPSIVLGTHTVQGRWRALGGSGTISRIINDDWISCCITEVYT